MDEQERTIVLVLGDERGWTILTPTGTVDPTPMPAAWAAVELRHLLPFLTADEDETD